MSRLRQLACLLLIALWVPATAHCTFEAIGLDALFHCEDEHHAAASPHSSDSCDVVESGWVKRAPSEIFVAAPVACACLISIVVTPPPDAASISPLSFADTTAAPPELGRAWQFHSRAAPSPRAPSAVS